MPELAEVEFNRRQWDAGLRKRVARVELRPDKRIFRGVDARRLRAGLANAALLESRAHGKHLLFKFSGGWWLALHLGMSGRLRIEDRAFRPGRHDHLVLRQRERSLVFCDPRLFGRVRAHQGTLPPAWWRQQPPSVADPAFTLSRMRAFLQRRWRLRLKAALLAQDGFPGIGNWMADEILWRAALHPLLPAGRVNEAQQRRLWRQIRWVSRRALEVIGRHGAEPPKGWLFHERWSDRGICPRHKTPLRRAAVGGRTTAWCEDCQPPGPSPSPGVPAPPGAVTGSAVEPRRCR